MATFAQWAKGKKLTRVTWVCGPERVLQDEVEVSYRAGLRLVGLTTQGWGTDTMDWLLTPPVSPELRLVREAEKLHSPNLIPTLLDETFDNAFTVFFSSEDDFSYLPGDKKRQLVPHLAALRDSRHGQIIRCCAPKDDEGKAAMVASWWPGAGKNIAAGLLTRCGGDLTEARQVITKANLAGLPATPENAAALCDHRPQDDYADRLLNGDKAGAMASASVISREETGRVLGLLTYRLSLLAVLGDAVRKGADMREVTARLRVDPYVTRLLRPHAAAYTAEKIARCREILALAETAWRSGASTGVLEAVVSLW